MGYLEYYNNILQAKNTPGDVLSRLKFVGEVTIAEAKNIALIISGSDQDELAEALESSLQRAAEYLACHIHCDVYGDWQAEQLTGRQDAYEALLCDAFHLTEEAARLWLPILVRAGQQRQICLALGAFFPLYLQAFACLVGEPAPTTSFFLDCPARQGFLPVKITKPGCLYACYEVEATEEYYRHEGEFNPAYQGPLLAHGLAFAAGSPDDIYLSGAEWPSHPFYMGLLYHPEQGQNNEPCHPVMRGLLRAVLSGQIMQKG